MYLAGCACQSVVVVAQACYCCCVITTIRCVNIRFGITIVSQCKGIFTHRILYGSSDRLRLAGVFQLRAAPFQSNRKRLNRQRTSYHIYIIVCSHQIFGSYVDGIRTGIVALYISAINCSLSLENACVIRSGKTAVGQCVGRCIRAVNHSCIRCRYGKRFLCNVNHCRCAFHAGVANAVIAAGNHAGVVAAVCDIFHIKCLADSTLDSVAILEPLIGCTGQCLAGCCCQRMRYAVILTVITNSRYCNSRAGNPLSVQCMVAALNRRCVVYTCCKCGIAVPAAEAPVAGLDGGRQCAVFVSCVISTRICFRHVAALRVECNSIGVICCCFPLCIERQNLAVCRLGNRTIYFVSSTVAILPAGEFITITAECGSLSSGCRIVYHLYIHAAAAAVCIVEQIPCIVCYLSCIHQNQRNILCNS